MSLSFQNNPMPISQRRLRSYYRPKPHQVVIQVDYSALESRLAAKIDYDAEIVYDMMKLGFQPGDYIRTKEGPRDIRICANGTSWFRSKDGMRDRLKIRVRKPGSKKAHWSWADRWVKASPLEALAAQAGRDG